LPPSLHDALPISTIDLTDLARAVAFMPTLFEAEHVDVEMKRAVHVGNEEHRTRVPPLNNLVFHGLRSVRANRRVESPVAPRAGKTRLVLNVVEVLVAELAHRGHDRANGRVAQRAERLAADVVAHVEKEVGVLLAPAAALEAVEDRLHPVRSLAARRALPAR